MAEQVAVRCPLEHEQNAGARGAAGCRTWKPVPRGQIDVEKGDEDAHQSAEA